MLPEEKYCTILKEYKTYLIWKQMKYIWTSTHKNTFGKVPKSSVKYIWKHMENYHV